MHKVQILIVEDNIREAKLMEKLLVANEYHVVSIAHSLQQANQQLSINRVDIILIDIFLEGKPNGIALAKSIIHKNNESIPFVFITGSRDRGIFEEAKLTGPFSFLLKPFNELELLYSIELSIQKFYSNLLQAQEHMLIDNCLMLIKKGKSYKKVHTDDISYIEVDGRYSYIYVCGDRFMIQMSLVNLLKILPKHKFIRTHRNCAINTEKINEINFHDNLIILEQNRKVVLSESYKANVVERFTILK